MLSVGPPRYVEGGGGLWRSMRLVLLSLHWLCANCVPQSCVRCLGMACLLCAGVVVV